MNSCTCTGQCGSDHQGSCGAPEDVQIVRSRADPARWRTAESLRLAFAAEHDAAVKGQGMLPIGDPLVHYLQGSLAVSLEVVPFGRDLQLLACRHCRRNAPQLAEPPPDLPDAPALQSGLFG